MTNDDGTQTATYATTPRGTALVLIDEQANMFDPQAPVADAAGELRW